MDAINTTARTAAMVSQQTATTPPVDEAVKGALSNAALVGAAKGLAESGRLWVPQADGSLEPTDTIGAITRLARGEPVAIVTVRAQEVVHRSSAQSSRRSRDGLFSASRSASANERQGTMVKLSWSASRISMLPALLAVESGTGIRAGVDSLPADGRPVTVFAASESHREGSYRGAGGFLFWFGDRAGRSESHTRTLSGSKEWIV